jgi:hypothetical protein
VTWVQTAFEMTLTGTVLLGVFAAELVLVCVGGYIVATITLSVVRSIVTRMYRQ